ncbi:hypothetical protein Pelo_6323 [Pelomyxa schiedti]|nr:hypothetical protein Pelo_6323 [Pelomyxa schiedti]
MTTTTTTVAPSRAHGAVFSQVDINIDARQQFVSGIGVGCIVGRTWVVGSNSSSSSSQRHFVVVLTKTSSPAQPASTTPKHLLAHVGFSVSLTGGLVSGPRLLFEDDSVESCRIVSGWIGTHVHGLRFAVTWRYKLSFMHDERLPSVTDTVTGRNIARMRGTLSGMMLRQEYVNHKWVVVFNQCNGSMSLWKALDLLKNYSVSALPTPEEFPPLVETAPSMELAMPTRVHILGDDYLVCIVGKKVHVVDLAATCDSGGKLACTTVEFDVVPTVCMWFGGRLYVAGEREDSCNNWAICFHTGEKFILPDHIRYMSHVGGPFYLVLNTEWQQKVYDIRDGPNTSKPICELAPLGQYCTAVFGRGLRVIDEQITTTGHNIKVVDVLSNFTIFSMSTSLYTLQTLHT